MAKKKNARMGTRRSAPLEENSYDMPETRTAARSRSRSSRAMKDDSSEGSSESRDYKTLLKDIAGNPAVRYVAGGIATAVLTRVATSLSQRYPEISRFISENLDNVEGKLGDFKNGLTGDSARQH